MSMPVKLVTVFNPKPVPELPSESVYVPVPLKLLESTSLTGAGVFLGSAYVNGDVGASPKSSDKIV